MKQAKYLPKGDYNIVSQEWQFWHFRSDNYFGGELSSAL